MDENDISPPPHDGIGGNTDQLQPPPYTPAPIHGLSIHDVPPAQGFTTTQEISKQGMPPQGYQTQGMPPQGYQTQGMPPQGYQTQGMPPQGYQTQGMPPQGYQTQGMPPQGFLAQENVNARSYAQGYSGPPGQLSGSNVLDSHGINPQHGFINPRPASNSQGQGRGIPQSQGQPQGFPRGDIRSSDHQPLPAPEVVQQDTIVRTVVLVAGQICPTCRRGVIREQLNVCMIVMAVLFFPLGLLFLLCAKEKVCNNCGVSCG